MPITQVITALPDAPDPANDTPTVFSTKAAASVLAQKAMTPELNAFGTQANAMAVSIAADAATATAGAATATTQAAAAVSGVNAAVWASGAFTDGQVRYSPINRRTYRKIGTAGGTTDPSLDTANWVLISNGPNLLTRSARSANTILAEADRGTLIDITSGTFTQTLTAAATLGNGWWCRLRNNGTGVVTVDPSGAETIDGLASRNSYQQEDIFLLTDGANWFTEIVRGFYFKSLSTVNFIMPSGYIEVESDLVGGGGGGGSGRQANDSSGRSGGAPGGAPAHVVRRHRNLAPGTSITLTVGAAGTGGAAQATNNTDGVDGTAGGNTSFGTLSVAYGGAAGKGGSNIYVANTSGSGSLSSGSSSSTLVVSSGGAPNFISNPGSTTPGAWSTMGASPAYVLNSEWGGAASYGSSVIPGPSTMMSGSSLYGVSAGGSGASINSSDQATLAGGTAGLNGTYTVGGGAAGGVSGTAPTAGANGAAATTDDACGNSGGGGGAATTGAATGAGKGGDGGFPGGAGGGGGASRQGQSSGAGGAGAAGRGIIKGII